MQIFEIENYIDYVLRAALSKCGDLHDAEDLAQETVMAVHGSHSAPVTMIPIRYLMKRMVRKSMEWQVKEVLQ